jgi:prevent-host-death family protein
VSRKTSIKPITYMKTHAADILAAVSETREAIVITHNGEGKMVIQDIDTYESNRQTIAMLKLAAATSNRRGKHSRTSRLGASPVVADREVFLTSESERDLEDLVDYIERHDSRREGGLRLQPYQEDHPQTGDLSRAGTYRAGAQRGRT